MRRPDPMSRAVPRWITVFVSALPAGGTAAIFILVSLLDIHLKLFNLSPKDSSLVVGIGSLLVFTVLALLILCLALMRAVSSSRS